MNNKWKIKQLYINIWNRAWQGNERTRVYQLATLFWLLLRHIGKHLGLKFDTTVVNISIRNDISGKYSRATRSV